MVTRRFFNFKSSSERPRIGSFVIRGPNYVVKIIAKFVHAEFVDFYFCVFFSFTFTSSSDRPKVGLFKSLESRSFFAHAQLQEVLD